MENPNPDRGGRTDRSPGKDDQGDVGTDPRRTREPDQEGDNQRQAPRRDERQDDTPKAG